MPNPKPPYPAQFRQQMVELVQAGHPASQLSREFGPHVASILSWVRQAQSAVPPGVQVPGVLSADERAELLALRKENRQIKIERDILAKATAWFANKGEQTYTPSTR